MQNPLTAPTIATLFDRRSDPIDRQLDAFYAHVRLPNGTFKTTTSNRQNDVNTWLIEQLRHHDLVRPAMRFLDVAVSSGVGTVEMDKAFRNAGMNVQTFGSDLTLTAQRQRLGPIHVLRDSTDPSHLYQVDIGPLAFPNTPPSRLGGSIHTATRILMRSPVKFLATTRSIRLLPPAVRDSGVRFATGDLFGDVYQTDDPSIKPFHGIRASNILNRSYFNDDQLRKAFDNLHGNLIDNGWLLVNRTDGQVNRATLLQRHKSQWRVLDHFGGGNEAARLLA